MKLRLLFSALLVSGLCIFGSGCAAARMLGIGDSAEVTATKNEMKQQAVAIGEKVQESVVQAQRIAKQIDDLKISMESGLLTKPAMEAAAAKLPILIGEYNIAKESVTASYAAYNEIVAKMKQYEEQTGGAWWETLLAVVVAGAAGFFGIPGIGVNRAAKAANAAVGTLVAAIENKPTADAIKISIAKKNDPVINGAVKNL